MSGREGDGLFVYALCKALEHAVDADRDEQAEELRQCLRRVYARLLATI